MMRPETAIDPPLCTLQAFRLHLSLERFVSAENAGIQRAICGAEYWYVPTVGKAIPGVDMPGVGKT